MASLAGAVVLSASVAPAFAQQVGFEPNARRAPVFNHDRFTSVTRRPQPEFDPVPLRVGDTELLLRADAMALATDNILADNLIKTGDVGVEGGVSAYDRYEWADNKLSARAYGGLRRWADRSSENAEMYGGAIAGVLGFGSGGGTLQAGASFDRGVLSRLATESPLSASGPVQLDEGNFYAGSTVGTGALRLWSKGSLRTQRFSQAGAISGVNEFRNRNIYEVEGQAEYVITPALYAFLNASYDKQDFLTAGPLGTRDSDGINVTAGFNVETPSLLRIDARIGYLTRRFTNPLFLDIQGFSYRLNAEFFATQTVTLTATARRDLRDSSRIGVGAFVSDAFDLAADLELRRNLITTARIGMAFDDYRGLDLAYTRLSASLSARYRLSRSFEVTPAAFFDRRTSSGSVPARAYDVASLRISTSYYF